MNHNDTTLASIEKQFQTCQPFVGYLTAGYLGRENTIASALALIEGGVNILEIGVPFSDPIADGPVIQGAMADAIARQTDFETILSIVAAIRKATTCPIILFSYMNPLLAHGLVESLTAAALAGVNGVLMVDLPPEASTNYQQACQQHRLAPIYLISPSTPPERIHLISQYGQGFLYYVCRNETTGVRQTMPGDLGNRLTTIRSLCKQPIITGFGIKNRQMAAEALIYADGFVVGSCFVKALMAGASAETLCQLAQSIDPRNINLNRL